MSPSRNRLPYRFVGGFLAGALVLALLWFSGAGFFSTRERDWKPLPWHLADIWWNFPEETEPFTMLSMDMEIAGQNVGEAPIYFAPIGLENIDGAPFYAGLQSGGKLPNGRGHLGIFSRWQERDPAALRTAPGGYAESAGYEGDFISVRRPIPWHAGRYRVSLTVEAAKSDDPRPWVRAEVLELGSGTRWEVGALRFPGGPEVHLGKSLASFVEIFDGGVSQDSVPHFTVIFSNLRINDQPVASSGGTIVYRDDIPALAGVQVGAPGTLIVDIGGSHERTGVTTDSKGNVFQRLHW